MQTQLLTITRFTGSAASVNSWIISNLSHSLLIDASGDEDDAGQLADQLETTKLVISGALITHGHADHCVGIRTIRERFTGARVMVASEAINEDIIGLDCPYMALSAPIWPACVRSISPDNPDSCDYEAIVEVLDDRELTLPGGGRLVLRADHLLVEAPHMTTAYVPEANALFVSDFAYSRVHPWLGPDVPRANIVNWIRGIADLKWRHAATDVRVFPGQGEAGGSELLDATRTDLCDFLAAASTSCSNKEMFDRPVTLYPDYEQANMKLAHGVVFHGPDSLNAAA